MNNGIRFEPAAILFLSGLSVFILLVAGRFVALPLGATAGQVFLLVGLPLWLNAQIARENSLFDVPARKVIFLVLYAATILLVLSLLSALHSNEPQRIGRVAISALAGIAIYFYFAGTLTASRLRKLCFALVTAMAVVAIISVAGTVFSPLHDLIYQGTDRAHGTFKNPNQYGIVTSSIAPLAAGLCVVQKGWGRLFAAVFLLLILTGLLLSGSKTNLLLTSISISLFALAIVVMSFRGRKLFLMLFLATALLAVAIVLGATILQALNPRAFQLLANLFTSQQELHSVQSRQLLWNYSMEMIALNPLTGVGAGTAIEIVAVESSISHSHNIFLDYGRTLGIPGMVAVTVIWCTAMCTAFLTLARLALDNLHSHPVNPLILASALGCICYLLSNLTSDSFGPSTSPFFWVTFFLMLAFVSLKRAEFNETETSRS